MCHEENGVSQKEKDMRDVFRASLLPQQGQREHATPRCLITEWQAMGVARWCDLQDSSGGVGELLDALVGWIYTEPWRLPACDLKPAA